MHILPQPKVKFNNHIRGRVLVPVVINHYGRLEKLFFKTSLNHFSFHLRISEDGFVTVSKRIIYKTILHQSHTDSAWRFFLLQTSFLMLLIYGKNILILIGNRRSLYVILLKHSTAAWTNYHLMTSHPNFALRLTAFNLTNLLLLLLMSTV